MNPLYSLISWALAGLLIIFPSAAQNLHYTVEMPEPHTHYFEVTLSLKLKPGEYADLKMATWAPGSYLIREFARNVEGFRAHTGNDTLEHQKISKNTWRVYTDGKRQIEVKYKVYAFEMSVRTSFLDSNHGYINGTSVFMYPDKQLDQPATVTIKPFAQWNEVTTGLESIPGSKFEFHSPNFETLADSPIEIGNHQVYHFTAAGTQHQIAMYGEGNYQIDLLLEDMATVVEKVTDVFGSNPNPEYTFIIHNLEKGSGGLEHVNSTSLQVNRWTYHPRNLYVRFLSLVAHEYFHLWNVKRLKPASFIPYDYENENYTRLLWVMEGITDYYDLLLVHSANLMSEDQFRAKLSALINSVERSPGKKVHSLADASFDAWIKAYRRDENYQNSSISYYAKGALIGMYIDLAILDKSNGKQSLDDMMRYLYREYYEENYTGLTDEKLIQTLSHFLGSDQTEFLDDYVYGLSPLEYGPSLGYVGLELVNNSNPEWVELGLSFNSGKVSRVLRGSTGYEGGINVGDEIIGLDGYRVRSSDLWKVLDNKSVGDSLSVDYVRDGRLREVKIKILPNPIPDYTIRTVDQPTEVQSALHRRWIRKPE